MFFFAGASQRVCPNSQPSTFALGKSCKGGMMLKWLSIFYIISVKNYVTYVRQCPRLRCWHSLAVSGNNWYHDAWWDCCNVCCIEVAWFCMAYHIAACGTAICMRKGPPSIFKWQHNLRKPLVMLASYPCCISLCAQTEKRIPTVYSHTAVKTLAGIPMNTR